ncbi:uncharacterized protein MYCFIDRAFT_206086 [Pseudocercospora fijiensis CIRAD86]|uniref:Uncharacterized protein n=1 Tax=Pseudocercospora fijiensis (strain CIRAD86) TaxID=383855 RepID=N1QBR5_PSEFD|nr:uncharacterized protein MYCFIDRAFT_206086 [Pseudocercospora fijiensis CIRAD86]EME88682.1 hypothetical protein MYCFIDRAFT_206086 [Pseudocercospora fijiensis CIRAD86]
MSSKGGASQTCFAILLQHTQIMYAQIDDFHGTDQEYIRFLELSGYAPSNGDNIDRGESMEYRGPAGETASFPVDETLSSSVSPTIGEPSSPAAKPKDLSQEIILVLRTLAEQGFWIPFFPTCLPSRFAAESNESALEIAISHTLNLNSVLHKAENIERGWARGTWSPRLTWNAGIRSTRNENATVRLNRSSGHTLLDTKPCPDMRSGNVSARRFDCHGMAPSSSLLVNKFASVHGMAGPSFHPGKLSNRIMTPWVESAVERESAGALDFPVPTWPAGGSSSRCQNEFRSLILCPYRLINCLSRLASRCHSPQEKVIFTAERAPFLPHPMIACRLPTGRTLRPAFVKHKSSETFLCLVLCFLHTHLPQSATSLTLLSLKVPHLSPFSPITTHDPSNTSQASDLSSYNSSNQVTPITTCSTDWDPQHQPSNERKTAKPPDQASCCQIPKGHRPMMIAFCTLRSDDMSPPPALTWVSQDKSLLSHTQVFDRRFGGKAFEFPSDASVCPPLTVGIIVVSSPYYLLIPACLVLSSRLDLKIKKGRNEEAGSAQNFNENRPLTGRCHLPCR